MTRRVATREAILRSDLARRPAEKNAERRNREGGNDSSCAAGSRPSPVRPGRSTDNQSASVTVAYVYIYIYIRAYSSSRRSSDERPRANAPVLLRSGSERRARALARTPPLYARIGTSSPRRRGFSRSSPSGIALHLVPLPAA